MHEIAHHFGFSDADIEALEREMEYSHLTVIARSKATKQSPSSVRTVLAPISNVRPLRILPAG